MGHTNIEEEIVQGGVHQCKGKDKPPVAGFARRKWTSAAMCHRQDNQSCCRKTNAGKEHLAACHVCGDAKSVEAYLDKREGPAPSYGCRHGKYHHPCRALEYGNVFRHSF